MSGGLADLDELILQCRGDEAKSYISEAVACYRAGAFRSCIVATWIAVVFDFLHKLRQLELAGDKNAQKHLREYEKLRRANDLPALLRFERQILEIAKNDFELLSQTEHDDLERLQSDRHRCAHPSMQSDTDPYRPNAELARYHLTSAVSCLLSQQPVQGKAALDRLWSEVRSEYFPTNTQQAVTAFETGPLRRARPSLVRSFVVDLVKVLIREEHTDPQQDRLFSALTAVYQMYTGEFESVLAKILPDIVAKVDDDEWPKIVAFLRRVPPSWSAIGEAGRTKAALVVSSASDWLEDEQVVADALRIPDLTETALSRADLLTSFTILKEFGVDPTPQLVDIAVDKFANSDNFRNSRHHGEQLLLPLASHLSSEQLKRALDGFISNRQIWDSIGMETIMEQLFDQTDSMVHDVENEWIQIYTMITSNQNFGSSWSALSTRIESQFAEATAKIKADEDFIDFDDVPF